MQKLQAEILSLCSSIPFLTIHSIGNASPVPGVQVDFTVKLDAGDSSWMWIVESKLCGQPREVRSALFQLKNTLSAFSESGRYGIFAAPYLSEESRKLCVQAGMGYVDLSGNARLCFGTVFIETRSKDNPYREKRVFKSLFSAKAGRILSILLTPPLRPWKVKKLSIAAGVSLGQASNVRKLLLDQEWAEARNEGLILLKPEELARAWQKAYKPLLHSKDTFYTMLSGNDLDAAVRAAFVEPGYDASAALASYSAARWYVPYARHATLFLYANTKGKEILKRHLGLQAVERGGNVIVLEPREDAVFSGRVEAAPGIWCSGLIQTWLDLSVAGERGNEAAEILLQQKLSPGWKESDR
ncbi:MAG: hypothetical protein A3J97_07635 [Spirochaetes bacterium RIFOXYC1_FULL_54_7]|nr:MAG: hypothetical protein A3J97_07635 [Spirochaetes bacterium RIFOXYC1_FULL_54_7]